MTSDRIAKMIHAAELTAPRITPEHIKDTIIKDDYHVFPDTLLTVCVLTLVNGFTVVGTSACVSPENFKEEIGREVAREGAVDKIWALEGYLLKQAQYLDTNQQ